MIGHLIHIGYPKTGSTLLRRWFAAHPQLAYADGGIAGFRSVYEIAKEGAVPRPGVLYRVTSSEALATPHATVGEAAVDYDRMRRQHIPTAQAQVAATLATLFPGAHVLLVTRGFRSMILSSYSQYLRSGGSSTLDELLEEFRGGTSVWHYDYLVDLYMRAFGRDKVMVLPYELLRDDADAFARTLEARLGLSHVAVPPERLNPSLSPGELWWYPRLTRVVRRLPLGGRLTMVYGRAVMENRFHGLIRVLERLRPGTPLTAVGIPDEVVNACRGRAESLRGDPLYAPYARDYLHH